MVIVDVILVVVTGAEPETGIETGVDPTTPELEPGSAPLNDEAGGRDRLATEEDDSTGIERLPEELGSPETLGCNDGPEMKPLGRFEAEEDDRTGPETLAEELGNPELLA